MLRAAAPGLHSLRSLRRGTPLHSYFLLGWVVFLECLTALFLDFAAFFAAFFSALAEPAAVLDWVFAPLVEACDHAGADSVNPSRAVKANVMSFFIFAPIKFKSLTRAGEVPFIAN